MRNKLLVILYSCICCYSYCQNWEDEFKEQQLLIDSIIIESQYSVRYVWEKENVRYPNDVVMNDTLSLRIGKHCSYSYFYSEKHLDVDSETQFQNLNTRYPVFFKRNWPCLGDVYNNCPDNKLTVLTYMDLAGTYKHCEDIPNFNWKIGNSTKTIIGYKCKNAICSFRGRTYEAWFTMDLPFNYGPWKFCGLPGLILEVYDTEKDYAFCCIGLQKKSNKHINFWNRKYIESTREKVYKTQRLLMKKPGTFIQDHGYNLMIDGRTGSALDLDLGHIPNFIEKE